MIIAAFAVRWFNSSVKPEQGVEHWQRHNCFDYASGVAEASYKQNVWKDCTVIHGDGHYCVIQEGGRIIGTTGSWHFSVGIQLPKTLNVDDTIELRSIKVPDASKSSLHIMVSGEVVAMEFGHPMSLDLESIDDIPHGKIQIKHIDEKSITVELEARFRLENQQILELDGEYLLERCYPTSPIDSLSRRIQISPK